MSKYGRLSSMITPQICEDILFQSADLLRKLIGTFPASKFSSIKFSDFEPMIVTKPEEDGIIELTTNFGLHIHLVGENNPTEPTGVVTVVTTTPDFFEVLTPCNLDGLYQEWGGYDVLPQSELESSILTFTYVYFSSLVFIESKEMPVNEV